MTNILTPDDKFDFEKVHLGNPTATHGGTFFSKILYGNTDDNLFIQSPKCKTKQGIITSGKKIYTDLLFNNNNVKFIEWINSLEELLQKEIFSRKDDWFVSDTLSMDDIQSAFVSPIKVYKGSNFLLRSYLQNGRASINADNCQIFDQNEEQKLESDITNETEIISILEVKGIKFSQRSFQIEFNLKQIMLLNTDTLFNKCIIKPYDESDTGLEENKKNEPIGINNLINNTSVKEQLTDKNSADDNNNNNNTSDTVDGVEENNIVIEVDTDNIKENIKENNETTNKTSINNEHGELGELGELSELGEINIVDDAVLNSLVENDDKTNISDPIKLKKPNEVYLELYKDAKRKAKDAKKIAITAYLKAKNIRDMYSLEEIDDSDDEDFNELLNE